MQLGLADRLLARTRDVLAQHGSSVGEVAELAAPLADALADALLIARSRGARLGKAGRALPGEVLDATPAESRAYGRRCFPGGDLASAPAVRKYVRDTARSWALPTGVTDDLETIAGELVANALEHSDSRTVTVACGLLPRSVTIGVTDQGDGRRPVVVGAQTGPSGADRERGRGLLITQALAHRWGAWPADGGLTVWAEVPVEADTR